MPSIPAHYPPPVQPGEFIATEPLPPDQRIDVGVLFVGAGPASLAGAIRLMQLLETSPQLKARLGECPVAILEKGKYVGAHLLSGAVLNPSAFRHLFPKLADTDFPFCNPVPGERVSFLTSKRAFPIPVPPTMRNHGNFVASLSQVGKWLAARAEECGVTILTETVGMKVLVHDGRVAGVRTGDKGRNQRGEPLPNFEPGVDVVGQYTVFGEGTQGHLTQSALEHFKISRAQPQIYALGVKEVWEVPQPLDAVVHTMGWPLRLGKAHREFGGSFAYPMGPNRISLGLVVGLDYADASLSVHDLLQELKTHPLFRTMLAGGHRIEQGWGAKTIPEGGLAALPEQLHVPGACVVGDSAGFVNVPALKGIHYAMWSGIYAAEAIFAALQAPSDANARDPLSAYDHAVRTSFIWKELAAVRNMRQVFHHGFVAGSMLAGLAALTNGRFPGGQCPSLPDSAHPVSAGTRTYPKPDNQLTFDKLDSVHAAGNRSRDNQPNHVRLATKVPEVIGEAWIHMCPALVYEWGPGAVGARELVINPTNCIHCGAVTAKGGRLTPPEGGSGPEYEWM
ncbi:MAG: 4Fe-4S dicluster domain-containing protein [Deltaproteobacteria bacterium]|nr:4Fe-4S dicluster domain-containing protein [Deltaproteobacteria bacterium]